MVSLKRNLHHPMILDDAKKYYIFILLIIYHFVKAYNIFGLNYANHTDMVICQVFENFTSAKNVLREKDHDFCDKFQVWCHCRPLGPSFRIITILHGEGGGGGGIVLQNYRRKMDCKNPCPTLDKGRSHLFFRNIS